MNIALKKAGIKYFTHIIITFIFAAKSLTSHNFDLSTFIFVENIIFKITKAIELFLLLIILSTTSSFTYRVILLFSFIY